MSLDKWDWMGYISGEDKEMNELARMLGLMAFLIGSSSVPAAAGIIDMTALALCESDNNSKAFNKKTSATGLYQVTPIVLKEWNRRHVSQLKQKDLFNAEICRVVAKWYLEKRIPELLAWARLPVTVQRVLWAWHAGIGNQVDGYYPEATRKFINRYNKLAGR